MINFVFPHCCYFGLEGGVQGGGVPPLLLWCAAILIVPLGEGAGLRDTSISTRRPPHDQPLSTHRRSPSNDGSPSTLFKDTGAGERRGAVHSTPTVILFPLDASSWPSYHKPSSDVIQTGTCTPVWDRTQIL